MKTEKNRGIYKKSMTAGLALAAAVLLTGAVLEAFRMYEPFYECERIGYGFLLITSVLLWSFIDFSQRKTSVKYIINAIWSLVFTALIFVFNSVLHFIDFNTMFDWVDPCPLWVFMKSDITYSEGYGEFRYFLVFALVFLANILLPALFIVLRLVKEKIEDSFFLSESEKTFEEFK